MPASLANEWRRRDRERQLIRSYPIASALVRCLESDAYVRTKTHQPGVLAAILRIDEELETRLLAELAAIEAIEFIRGKWRPKDTRLAYDRDTACTVAAFWLRKLADALPTFHSTPSAFNGFTSVACSEPTMIKARALYSQFCSEASDLIRADNNPGQRVAIQLYSQIWVDDLIAAEEAARKGRS